MGGRLRYFFPFWKRISRDNFVLNSIKGLKIPVTRSVRQIRTPHPINMSPEEVAFVDKKLEYLLREKCIVKQNSRDIKQFYINNIFLVPKRQQGQFRVILNCAHFNREYLKAKHYKMESIKDIIRLAVKGTFLTTCDITDSYSHVYIRPEDHWLLSFIWKNTIYSFCSLAQGLSVSPYIFCRLCRQIGGYLRGQGHKNVFYMDDVTTVGYSYKQCLDSTHTLIRTLGKAGFLVNFEKSQLIPSQRIEVLGFVVDSRSESICLTEKKQRSLVKLFSEALTLKVVSIRKFAKYIGCCVSCFVCFPFGKRHYRDLEHSKLRALRLNKFKWNKNMRLSHSDKKTLKWWLHTFQQNKPFCYKLKMVTRVLESDSSLEGWGISLLDNLGNQLGQTGSRFGFKDVKNPINNKELLAVKYGLLSFKTCLANRHVHFKTDSTCVLADMTKQGSMCNVFRDRLVADIYEIIEKNNIQVSISWISSQRNFRADERSRIFTSEVSEWTLSSDMFDLIKKRVPTLNFDLFSSHLNNQLKDFASFSFAPGCSVINAFTFDWNLRTCYAFPCRNLYLKCFTYVKTLPVSSVYFIVPWERTAVFFPLMKELLVEPPFMLPNNAAKKLYLPFPTKLKGHPQQRCLRLAFVHLSGNI